MSKLFTFIRVFFVFKNWQTYFKDYFGRIKEKEFVLFLRNGLQFKVRTGTADRGILNEVWVHKVYAEKGFEIGEKDIIVDIGAQIGAYSICAAKLAKKGKVYAFEPAKDNYKILNYNVTVNKIKNLVAFNQAVSDKEGNETLFMNSINTGGHTFYNEMFHLKKSSGVYVKSVSLNSFVKKYKIKKIDILKLDCEGAEYKILFGCSDEILGRIQKITMEYHNVDKKYNGIELRKFLEKKGFIVRQDFRDGYVLYAHK